MSASIDMPSWVPDTVRIIDLPTYEDWQVERFKGLGASDASTVFGVNPYQSKYDLWALKTGRAQPQLPKRILRYGQINEQIVREAYEEDNEVTVWHRPNFMFQHIEDDWLRYSPDGLVQEFPRLFEAKTARRDNEWRTESSDHAEAQVSAGMAVIGSSQVDADIKVMVGGDPDNMLQFTIPYSQDVVDAVREEMARFWHDHIVKDVPPEPDHRSLDTLLGQYRESLPGSVVHVKGAERKNALEAIEQFQKGRRMVANGTKIRDTGKARLLRIAGEYETVETTAGKELFTYHSSTTRRVTNGALIRAGLEPDDYREENTTRTLRVN